MAKDKRPQVAAPSWLKWILIAFIAYAAFLHFTTGEKAANHTSMAAASGFASSAARDYRQQQNVQIGGDIPGTGEDALCGQAAEVKVTGKYPDGTTIEHVDGTQPITLSVGAATKDSPWAPGIIGMKVGGVREVILPASTLEEATQKAKQLDKDANLQYRIELFSLNPNLPPNTLAFRATELTIGNGDEAACGDTVKVHLVLWGADGQMLYSTLKDNNKEPITLTIGENALFYGLDRGVLGMHEGGGRSVVIPPAYLQPNPATVKSPEIDKILEKLPKGAIVLADVTLVKKVRK